MHRKRGCPGVSSNLSIVNVIDKHYNPVSVPETAITQNNTDAFVSAKTQTLTGTTTYAFTLVTATGTIHLPPLINPERH